MYIYTKIEIQTNTHIPITPFPTAAHPRTQSTLTQDKRSGDTISTTYYRK